MNTLQLIRKQITKASALHDAQISHTAYRGVEYNVNCAEHKDCLLYTSPSPRDATLSRMPSSA